MKPLCIALLATVLLAPSLTLAAPETKKQGKAAVATDKPADTDTTPAAASPIPSLTAEQELAFTLSLFRKTSAELGPKDLKNSILCPGGIMRLLQALHAGSTGNTQKQIAAALKLDAKAGPASPPTLPPVMKQASAVWADPAHALKPAFTQSIQTALSASAQTVPLQKDPESSRQTINAWAAEHTGGNIKELLKPADMKGAQLVLTDAAWFKDAWKTAFLPEKSLTADFTLPDGKKQATRFVADRRKALYAKTAAAEALALPFGTARYQCVCLLPTMKPKETAAAALLRLERDLGPKVLGDLTDALKEQEVAMQLPKLDLQNIEADIKPLLQALDIKALFTNAADLSPMCEGGQDLKVDAFKQVAAFKLDEQGAEAAAATAVVIISKSAVVRTPPIPFHANRPCLFLVRDVETGNVAFLVRCAVPSIAKQAQGTN
jgi:serpin B